MKLDRITPNMLRPLPSVMRGSACVGCNKAQASWNVETPLGEEDRVQICSLCVLSETEWAKRSQTAIQAAIESVSKARGEAFAKDSKGRLSSATQADHVLGVLVLTERVKSVRGIAEDLR